MYSQDWVAHMKHAMEHGQPGDSYEVCHLALFDNGSKSLISSTGSCYVKTETGYRSCLLSNADITGIKLAPFRI